MIPVGYKRPKATFALSFEDETMEGLEVRCQSVSLETYLRVFELTTGGVDFTPANRDRLSEVLDTFCASVIEWNLEDEDDQPLPCTAATVMAQDRAFIVRLIDAWVTGMVEVPGPLPKPSVAFVTSLEQSLPMEPLSENLAS